MKSIIFLNVKLKFIIFEGKRPLVETDQLQNFSHLNFL